MPNKITLMGFDRKYTRYKEQFLFSGGLRKKFAHCVVFDYQYDDCVISSRWVIIDGKWTGESGGGMGRVPLVSPDKIKLIEKKMQQSADELWEIIDAE